jgi:dihydrofolate synthase/folylpolyglutamate synthase
MSQKTLNSWLTHLEGAHSKEIDLGLDRVREVAQVMRLSPSVPVITVAGTNGKGSTVRVLQALLKTMGVRSGVFTSPHLLRFNERIVIDDRVATDQDIIGAFEAIEQARGQVSLSYYEVSTLAAAYLFDRSDVNVWLLEVGLGGRLDAVNIFDATVSVVTSIDLDHQAYLGDTRDAIAIEKAGVARCGSPCVVAESNLPSTLIPELERIGAIPITIGRDFTFTIGPNGARWDGQWSWDGVALDITEIESPAFIESNVAGAIAAVLALGFELDEQSVKRALHGLDLSGRRQTIELDGRKVLCDVAHNPASVAALARYQRQHNPGATVCRAVFSVMSDKDIAAMLLQGNEFIDVWYLAGQQNERVASVEVVSDLITAQLQTESHVFNNVRSAINAMICDANDGDTLIVMGSFTTVAVALAMVDNRAEVVREC